MNIKKINFFIAVIILFVIFSCSQDTLAQGQDSVITLTLDKAISIAIENNRDIQLAKQDFNKAQSQIDEAYANVWPTINFTGQYQRNIKLPVLFLPPNSPFNPSSSPQTFSLGANNSYNLGFSLSQTLFSLKVNTAIKIASDYSNYYESNQTATEQDIIYQVKQAFYTILLSQKLVDVNQSGYDVAKANLDNTEKMYQQGVSSEYDYLRAQVQLANVEPALIEAKNNLELAKNNLKNILAIDLNKDIKAKGEFKLEEIDQGTLQNSDTLLIKNNPVLQGLKFQESVLDKNITLQKADYFPTLSAFANYAWQTQDNTFKFKNYLWAETFAVGLQISLPIFDGFRRSSLVQQAIIDRDKIDITKQKTEELLKISVLQSELKMKEAQERVQAQLKSVDQAKKALQIAETRYKNGIGTQLEILDTQSALTVTETNYAKAIYDFLIAKADWEKTVGLSTDSK
jgi:outer membrane protein